MKDRYYKFHCKNGKTYGVKEGVCFACKKCSDIFVDWNGPYGYSCEDNHHEDEDFEFGECKYFEVDEELEEIKGE